MFWFLWYHLTYKSGESNAKSEDTAVPPQKYIPERPGFEVEEYQCPVCYGILIDPVIGTCGHDFCKRCVDNWTTHQRKSGRELHCPVCRTAWRGLHRQPLGVCLRYKAFLEKAFPQEIQARLREVAAGPGIVDPGPRPILEASTLQQAYHSAALDNATAFVHTLPTSQGTVELPQQGIDSNDNVQHSIVGRRSSLTEVNSRVTEVTAFDAGIRGSPPSSFTPMVELLDSEEIGHSPQYHVNGRYQIPPWYPPFQIMSTPVSRTIVELCRRALQDGEVVGSGDEDATYTSTDEILQQLKISIAFALGVQDDMRLFDHFFQNAVQMRVPSGWSIWQDWAQFQSFGEAILQRWPQDRPTLQVRHELLNEFQVALDDHSSLIQGQPGTRYFVLETLLDDVRLSLAEILRMPASCPLPHLRSELGLRLLIHCSANVWEDWDCFQEYACSVLERWRMRETGAAAPPPEAFTVAELWQEVPGNRPSYSPSHRPPGHPPRHASTATAFARSPPPANGAVRPSQQTAVAGNNRSLLTGHFGNGSLPHPSGRQVIAVGYSTQPAAVHGAGGLRAQYVAGSSSHGVAVQQGRPVGRHDVMGRRIQSQGMVQNRPHRGSPHS